MLNLNIADPKKTDIAFLISKYPDGQQDMRILDKRSQQELISKGNLSPNTLKETELDFIQFKNAEITISSRFNSIADLNIIKCAVACLRRLKVSKISLYIPYLLGARADRKFAEGGCSYLVDVIAPDLKALGFEDITVIDVHSEVSPGCIPNLVNISVLPKLTNLAIQEVKKEGKSNCHFISPDSGASKRSFETCKELIIEFSELANYFDLIECAKHRDLISGKILETVVPVSDMGGEDAVIVDDICSKGGTFMGLAQVMNNKNCGDKYLVITHFEGTADIKQLKEAGIKGVFTTNSIGNFETPDGFIKQIEVF